MISKVTMIIFFIIIGIIFITVIKSSGPADSALNALRWIAAIFALITAGALTIGK